MMRRLSDEGWSDAGDDDCQPETRLYRMAGGENCRVMLILELIQMARRRDAMPQDEECAERNE
jgi:hypothetical protein